MGSLAGNSVRRISVLLPDFILIIILAGFYHLESKSQKKDWKWRLY